MHEDVLELLLRIIEQVYWMKPVAAAAAEMPNLSSPLSALSAACGVHWLACGIFDHCPQAHSTIGAWHHLTLQDHANMAHAFSSVWDWILRARQAAELCSQKADKQALPGRLTAAVVASSFWLLSFGCRRGVVGQQPEFYMPLQSHRECHITGGHWKQLTQIPPVSCCSSTYSEGK